MRSARIRLGMVGGGEGAFIGAVHRIAVRLDDEFELVAGAFSSDPGRSARSGHILGLPAERIYDDFETMARKEAARPDGIEVVSIVTPNHLHARVALAFLGRGIHVVCDKPLTTNLDDAIRLREAARRSGLVFAVTYNYTGYPLVRHAREMVRNGLLGLIRVVQVEYAQDWLAEPVESTGQKQAAWRTDPERAGPAGAIGDIGTHAYHLAGFITGLEPVELQADISTFVEGRRVDDNAHILLRYENGARGMLWVSQVAPGHENGLRIRLFGAKGGLEWSQENPNQLLWSRLGEATQIVSRGGPPVGTLAMGATRIPAGHPEGYLEAFATTYTEVAQAVRFAASGADPDPNLLLPTIEDGVKGVAFIEAALRSAREGGWVRL